MTYTVPTMTALAASQDACEAAGLSALFVARIYTDLAISRSRGFWGGWNFRVHPSGKGCVLGYEQAGEQAALALYLLENLDGFLSAAGPYGALGRGAMLPGLMATSEAVRAARKRHAPDLSLEELIPLLFGRSRAWNDSRELVGDPVDLSIDQDGQISIAVQAGDPLENMTPETEDALIRIMGRVLNG